MADLTRVRVVYRMAARLYPRLLAVCALTLVPGLLTPLAALILLRGDVALVDGVPRFITLGPISRTVAAAAVFIAIASGFAALAGGSRLVLDVIDGRPPSPTRAVAAALRRPHSFLLLMAQFGMAAVVLLAIGLSLLRTAPSAIPAVIVVTGIVIAAIPHLIAWTALTDRVPPLRTTWRLASRAYGEAVWVLGLGYLTFPVLVQLGLYGLSTVLPPAGGTVTGILQMTAAVLQTPFQAAAMACSYAYLRRLAGRSPAPAAARSAPSPAQHVGRARRWWPLLVALLPGLLWTGYANTPLGVAGLVDHEIGAKEWDADFPSRTEIVLGPGGAPIVFRDERRPVMVFCGDGTCGSHVTVTLDEYFQTSPAVAVAPDGSLVVAGWTEEIGGSPMRLEMFSCRPDGCVRRLGGPLKVTEESSSDAQAAAVAIPGGLAVAWSVPVPGHAKKPLSRVELALCQDVTCARRRIVPMGEISDTFTLEDMDARVLAVAASPDGRPVVAYVDRKTHKLTVASCDSRTCARPAIHAFGLPALTTYTWLTSNLRTQVAVRPDGRPVILQSDPGDGHTSTLLLCADPACSGTPRSVPVPELIAVSAPGLALDARGLPLLAGYRRKGSALIDAVTCQDQDCARRSVSHLLPADGVGQFDLAAGPGHRPHILWYGRADPARDPAYHVLTCADPHCAP